MQEQQYGAPPPPPPPPPPQAFLPAIEVHEQNQQSLPQQTPGAPGHPQLPNVHQLMPLPPPPDMLVHHQGQQAYGMTGGMEQQPQYHAQPSPLPPQPEGTASVSLTSAPTEPSQQTYESMTVEEQQVCLQQWEQWQQYYSLQDQQHQAAQQQMMQQSQQQQQHHSQVQPQQYYQDASGNYHAYDASAQQQYGTQPVCDWRSLFSLLSHSPCAVSNTSSMTVQQT